MKFLASATKELSQEAFLRRFDRCLAFWTVPSGYFAWHLWRVHRIPYDVWVLGSDMYKYARFPVLRSLTRTILRNAALVMSDSQYLADMTSGFAGRPCPVVRSARDLPAWPRNNEGGGGRRVRFLYVGRLEREKGIDLLMDSMISLRKGTAGFSLDIVGFGRLKQSVERIIKDNRLGDSIRLHESRGMEANLEFMRRSDYLVIPSRQESLPLVLGEAVHSGLPILGSDLPDLAHLIRRFGIGLTFRRNDRIDLARKISYLSSNRMIHETFRKRICDMPSEAFSLDESIRAYQTLLFHGSC